MFEYRLPDGTTRREYRSPDEVFKQDSLDTFELAPVTDDHPPEMVTPANARKYAVGAVGEVIKRDGDHLRAQLTIFDADVITKMEHGKVQISCGYHCDLIPGPGVTPEGEHYDFKQANISLNHVAVVAVGRAGPTASVRMDAGEMIETAKLDESNKQTEHVTMELKEALDQLKKASERADAAEARASEIRATADKLQAERDNALAQLASAEKARTDAVESIQARVAARVSLETQAGSILGKSDFSKMSDREIKCAVVKHFDAVEIAGDKSEDYVTARFDGVVERAVKSAQAIAETRVAVDQTKLDAGADLEEQAIRKYRERSANAYLETLKRGV